MRENTKNAGKNITGKQNVQLEKSYGSDPYFIKKAKESKEFLDKHGFPKEILVKK
jgi:hypothetical protein